MARSQDSPELMRARRQNFAAGSNPQTAAQARVASSQFLKPGRAMASSRQNRYGTSDPYATNPAGTNQNPYVGIAWLGSGFPHPLPSVPDKVPVDPAFTRLQYAASRPSYDLAGIGALLGAYYHIPIRFDYSVLVKIRETIPMISAAILRLKELVGFPEIQAAPNLKRELDDWASALPVNRMQNGLEIWLQSHLDNVLTFGRSHAEVILNNRRDDVFGLVEVDPRTCALRPTFGGYGTHVVQYQYGGGVPVTLIPELLLSSVYDIRGDDPNGTSAIAELPFTAQILNSMLRSIGNTWDRFGSPTYWVNWEPPEHWDDPTGAQSAAILAPMISNLQGAMRNRAEGRAGDFFTTGRVTVEILGAQGQELRFEETGRALFEQITARFGLPPFLYGFSWSSTERMSSAQAKMVTQLIQSLRSIVEPTIRKLIDLRMLLTGRRGAYSLHWDSVSMVDKLDLARSSLMDSQAEQLALASWDRKCRLGINSLEEMAAHFRGDMEGTPMTQVRRRLNGKEGMPLLVSELPDAMAVPLGGESFGGISPSEGLTPQDSTREKPRGSRNVQQPREDTMHSYPSNGNGRGDY